MSREAKYYTRLPRISQAKCYEAETECPSLLTVLAAYIGLGFVECIITSVCKAVTASLGLCAALQ